jgi:hypothetical protein
VSQYTGWRQAVAGTQPPGENGGSKLAIQLVRKPVTRACAPLERHQKIYSMAIIEIG